MIQLVDLETGFWYGSVAGRSWATFVFVPFLHARWLDFDDFVNECAFHHHALCFCASVMHCFGNRTDARGS